MVMTISTKCATISIQSDWDRELRTLGNHVWVSYKFKDSPSVQGKIKCVKGDSGKIIYEASSNFVVKSITPKDIEIFCPEIKQTALFLAPLKTYSKLHSKSVLSLDVTSNGLAVSSGTNNELFVWDTVQDERKLTLKGHVCDVYQCRFFPSEKVILTCSADMRLKIWCAETGICPVTLTGHTQAVTGFDIIDRGKNVLSVSKDGTAKLWHCGSGLCIGDVIKVHSKINCCCLYSSKLDETASFDDKEIGTENKVALIGCEDGMVYCVAVRSREVQFTLPLASSVNCIVCLKESLFVVGCQNGQLLIVSVTDNKPIVSEECYHSNSAILVLFPHKQTGVYVGRADGSVAFHLLADTSRSLYLTGPDCDPIYDITTDGSYLFTSSRDGFVRRYHTKIPLSKLYGPGI